MSRAMSNFSRTFNRRIFSQVIDATARRCDITIDRALIDELRESWRKVNSVDFVDSISAEAEDAFVHLECIAAEQLLFDEASMDRWENEGGAL